MQLIIVESPTKAKTLTRFLGKGYDVDSTRGHIKDLPKSKLGVEIEKNFAPSYEVVAKKKDVIRDLQSKAKKADSIYIATDPDREGEAIASHVREIITDSKKGTKGKEIKRITFHEITKAAVEDAIAHPSVVNTNLVDAQIARRVLDRLVGYKLSPLLWKKVRRGLSAGRVQSVAVRLIVERENEIKAFKPVEYWEIFVDVKRQVGEKEKFTLSLIKKEVSDKKTADEVVSDLEKSSYKISEVKKREVKKNAYPPFTTSTMTQAAARLFGWSAKRTMTIAQKLYEEGLITYHRTDSTNLNFDAVNVARDYISKNFGENYLPEKPIFYRTKSKSAQEAHEAIRVTDVNKLPQELDRANEEKKLYDLIWKKFVSCQMRAAIYDETTIDVTTEPQKYLLRASGQVMKFDGWRKLFPRDTEVVLLPEVVKDETLDKEKVRGDQKFTQPPARFNEASIIKTLEKLGIGRPSTYAPIINTIQLRGYVEKVERAFIPTSVGFAVTEFLMKNFPEELEYGFTAEMEGNLDKVADGNKKWQDLMSTFWKPFDKKLVDVEKNSERVKIEAEKLNKPCPTCNEGELVIRQGRFGKFISCSRFPDCKHTEKYLELAGMKCPDCNKGDVIIKKAKRGKFYGCSRYPECKFASWRKPTNSPTMSK